MMILLSLDEDRIRGTDRFIESIRRRIRRKGTFNCLFMKWMSSMFMDVKYKSGHSKDRFIDNHSDVCKNRYGWFGSLALGSHYLIRVITETHNQFDTVI